MFFNEVIGWIVTDNRVKDRLIDNSLTHKFASSSKIRKRTKTLNTKIKKYSYVKDYKHYIKLKTNVIRDVIEDTDTDNSGNLSETDYDIIYNSFSTQDKNLDDDSENNIFNKKDDKRFKRKIQAKLKEKNDIKKKASKPKRKSVETKCSTSASKKHINNRDCQKVTKKDKDISHFFNKQTCTNNEKNLSKNNNSGYLEAQSNNQSFSIQFDFQNSTTSNIIKSVNENIKENCEDSNAEVNETNQDSTVSNEIKLNKSEICDYKEQNTVTNKSNTKLDSQKPSDSPSKYHAPLSKLISLKNIEDTDNEISTVIKLGNNKAEINSKTLVNQKNYSNTYESQKSKSVKSVRKNLTPVLEEVDLMNNDKSIEKNKNSIKKQEDRLNYDQSLVPITSSTPIKKMHTNLSKNLSPDILLLDQQKDSGLDEDSQDKFEQNDMRSSANLDIAEKMLVSPQQFNENITEVETIALKNFEEDIKHDNIVDKQDNKEEKKLSRKEGTSSFQLMQIDKDISKQETSLIRSKEKTKFVKAEENIEKHQSSPKKDKKNVNVKLCKNILEEQNSKEEEPFGGKVKNFQLNEVNEDAEIYSINYEDKTHSVTLEDSCNVEKRHLLPKITCSEIINKKYTIINKGDNDSIEKNDINFQEKMLEEIDNNVSLTMETDNEEDNVNYISPETKKRLQQQATLNLVVNSDSSQSDDECTTVEILRKHVNDSDTSCSNDMFENSRTNCKVNNTDILSINKETTPVLTKENDSLNQNDKTVLLTNCTYENNNRSAVNKNSLKEMQYSKNASNDENNRNENIEESFELKVSDDKISHINEESKSQSRNKSLLDKENFCDKSTQSKDEMTSKFGTMCEPEHEQNKQVSTKRLNAHLDISDFRPCNLQQLVEDEKLLVETIPAGFTLADLSEDDEAFILNVPNKVLQCNLQGQLLTLKKKTVKFGEDKYRIVCRKLGTVSCIFNTGKQQRPYKIVNIKDISTITIRERLHTHCSRKSDIEQYSNISYTETNSSVISSELESSRINQTNKTSSKMPKVDRHKHKRKNSDFDAEQSAIKKRKLKLIHS